MSRSCPPPSSTKSRSTAVRMNWRSPVGSLGRHAPDTGSVLACGRRQSTGANVPSSPHLALTTRFLLFDTSLPLPDDHISTAGVEGHLGCRPRLPDPADRATPDV